MKKLLYTYFVIVFTSCSFLDIDSPNVLTEDDLFEDENITTAYFSRLYQELLIEDFNFVQGKFNTFPGSGSNYIGSWVNEELPSGTYTGIGGGSFEKCYEVAYKAIANCNQLIEDLEKSRFKFTAQQYNQYLAEAYFLRSYNYFELAKMFGGVPLVLKLKPYEIGDELSKFHKARNSEEEVFDQIRQDLDFAIQYLPETSQYGRSNRYVAAALKSRAMLYAACIAKYGTPNRLVTPDYPNGLLGIPADRAKELFKYVIDANELIIQSGNYYLFEQLRDKEENFQTLFLQTQNNREVLFARGFDPAVRNSHSHDAIVMPRSIGFTYGNKKSPSTNIMEKFEYVDGRSGEMVWKNGKEYVVFDDLQTLFKDKDPRFFASFITPFSEFRDLKITMCNGVHLDGAFKTAPIGYNYYYDLEKQEFVSYVTDYPATGNSGQTQGSVGNGFCKKYTDIDNPIQSIGALWSSKTHWIDIRYAEILLNHAEAHFEMGNYESAHINLNMIRERAGIVPLEFGDVTLEKIRNERIVEFVYENKSFWDYRRWRTMTTEFNNESASRYRIYYSIDLGGYIIRDDQNNGAKKQYDERFYYNRIPLEEMAKDPLLIQNPGY
ncbi:RagB/SusD family nutrient uptake outer membrane protein [Flammeovirga aprica]|uniref:RagB/SusD family nutrient uptake outer membrane protein n=1 Tax=Flammeovirga aprica JL-4 TaxID=694437 RepID=A0A7X9S125_9BACT|nr:RagB/SusD family nutrient uptake outer membrane protein [Flammeovirga aprica]NME72451.1 RagB/SusD family nutrient uptake outer membrane protein [Flammeovirga aprica JL-4]